MTRIETVVLAIVGFADALDKRIPACAGITGWVPVGIVTRSLKQSEVTPVSQKHGPRWIARGLIVVLSGNGKSAPSLGAGCRPRKRDQGVTTEPG